MAGILTLLPINSLAVLRSHWRFALARLKSDPNAAPFVAEFTAFDPVLATAAQTELTLDDGVTDAEALVIAADGGVPGLDVLVNLVVVAIHGAKKPDIQNPLHQLYLGSQNATEFKKPILGTELEKCQTWPQKLAAATQPALVALAPQATDILKTANDAAKTLKDAIAARESFRLGGARQQAFDAFNSMCAKAYGALKSFVHDHPELGLPTGYAESFFKGSARSPHDKSVSVTADLAAKAQAKAAKAQAKADAALKTAADKAAAAADHAEKVAAAKAAKKTAKDAAKAAKAATDAAKKKK
jgi:chemotaxis protein histidine kinase CheA